MNKAVDEINAQIKKLQNEQERLKATLRRTEEVRKIIILMRDTAITPQDILAAFSTGRAKGKGAARPNARKPRGPVAPKYRHPGTGATWSGRGKTPRWLVAEEQDGKGREEYRILEAS